MLRLVLSVVKKGSGVRGLREVGWHGLCDLMWLGPGDVVSISCSTVAHQARPLFDFRLFDRATHLPSASICVLRAEYDAEDNHVSFPYMSNSPSHGHSEYWN